MIYNILSKKNTSNKKNFTTKSNYNKNTQNISNSPISIKNNTPNTNKNNQLYTPTKIYINTLNHI